MATAKKVTYQGIEYSLRGLANKFKVPYSSLRVRLEQGLSVQEALFGKNDEGVKTRPPAYKLVWNGQTHTLKEWANILGIKHATLMARVQRGWSTSSVLGGRDGKSTIPKPRGRHVSKQQHVSA